MTEGDDDLLERCRRGDENAWRELVTRHTVPTLPSLILSTTV